MKNRNIIFPIILIIGIILFLFNDLGVVKWYNLKQHRFKLEQDIEKLIFEEKSLIDELNRLKNDNDYIKKIAREKFHMVAPGEKVFRVKNKRNVNITK